jgi:hypothetical protein
MRKTEKGIKMECEASYSPCAVDFKSIDSKLDWTTYEKKKKKSRKGLLWGSLASLSFLLFLALLLPRVLTPGQATNPGRLVAGEYALDLSRSTGEWGSMAFESGERISVVSLGEGKGPGVVELPGDGGSFKGTLSFVDGPLSEWSLGEVTKVSLTDYDFTMKLDDKILQIDINCQKSWDAYSYIVGIHNPEKTISCYLDYA